VSHAPITEVEKVLRVFQTITAPAITGAAVYSGIQ